MKKPELPNVSERKNPSGKIVYRLDYKDPATGKRVREVVGSRKADALKRANQIYQQQMAQFLGDPVALPTDYLSLQTAIDQYLASKAGRVAESSLSRYGIYARNFVAFMTSKFPGVNGIKGVKQAYIEEHLQDLRKQGHMPKTLNGALQFLKGLSRWASKEQHIPNPAVDIKSFPEKLNARGVEFWTVEEVKMILDAVKPHWHDIFEFLYNTGLRKGELIHLTWADVKLDDPLPSIMIQAKEGWSTKTSQQRVVRLNKRAKEILQRQPHSQKHPYVFTGTEGGKIHHDRVYVALKTTLAKLNLTGDVHQFRHTFASHLVMKGVGIESVSKLLGHTTIEMTMRYAHLSPDHLQAAVEMLSLD